MELKGYQGSSNCGCSILLRRFETRLRVATMRMRIMTGCAVRVTNVYISIVLYSLTVDQSCLKGRGRASGDGSCS